MEKKELSFRQYVYLILIALVGILIICNISTLKKIILSVFNIFFPFILGASLAYVINIPMSFLERKLGKIKNKKVLRFVSLISAILVIILIFVLVITLIFPKLIEVVKLLIDNIPYYTEEINIFLEQMGSDFSLESASMNITAESLKEELIVYIPNILTTSISVISSVVSGISTFVISFIFAIYILIDKEKLKTQITMLLDANMSKKVTSKIKSILVIANNVFRKFFTVQCLEAVILGSLCTLGMLILNIPYAIPIGVLVGVTALIPIVGAFIGMAVGAILIVSISPVKALYFIIFLLILQQIENNFIYPKVVGTSIGLPGMWVLFAVTVGGSIGGVVGMIIGVPIATTVYLLIKENTTEKLKRKGL